ncbi:MAG: cobyrinate a,c-diamide synthase [Lachnospiraceae bacterium]|nr:cobyrinate a,c-diamide synthase [Candidatus Merdinaster equi]
MKKAFLIAATGSGCGKTTITCALLSTIKNRNMTLRAFKCGPDYIDPMFHKTVLGIESQNLDLFFSSDEELERIFYAENCADVSVVEGVMGLYDGISTSSNEGSSYELACKLDIPVFLVVNAHGMGRSLIALIKGFLEMDTEQKIKGVILNQISPMYYETISRQIELELGVAALGYFPKVGDINLESRYLGLKMPNEIEQIEDNIKKAEKIISETVDIDRMLQISVTGREAKSVSEIEEVLHDVRIGVARDEAFCFFYEENLKLLRKLGAETVEFSPIHDKVLPDNIDGLLLGGGYPELYADKLSSNIKMLSSIKDAISRGVPSLAECGGFMYLHDAICVDGTEYPMVGVVEGTCSKKERLVRFGYLTISENADSFMSSGNKGIKGHEFHYYDSTNNGEDGTSVKPGGNRSWKSAHISENHWWGFAHLYYQTNVGFAKAFIDKCIKWRNINE